MNEGTQIIIRFAKTVDSAAETILKSTELVSIDVEKKDLQRLRACLGAYQTTGGEMSHNLVLRTLAGFKLQNGAVYVLVPESNSLYLTGLSCPLNQIVIEVCRF